MLAQQKVTEHETKLKAEMKLESKAQEDKIKLNEAEAVRRVESLEQQGNAEVAVEKQNIEEEKLKVGQQVMTEHFDVQSHLGSAEAELRKAHAEFEQLMAVRKVETPQQGSHPLQPQPDMMDRAQQLEGEYLAEMQSVATMWTTRSQMVQNAQNTLQSEWARIQQAECWMTEMHQTLQLRVSEQKLATLRHAKLVAEAAAESAQAQQGRLETMWLISQHQMALNQLTSTYQVPKAVAGGDDPGHDRGLPDFSKATETMTYPAQTQKVSTEPQVGVLQSAGGASHSWSGFTSGGTFGGQLGGGSNPPGIGPFGGIGRNLSSAPPPVPVMNVKEEPVEPGGEGNDGDNNGNGSDGAPPTPPSPFQGLHDGPQQPSTPRTKAEYPKGNGPPGGNGLPSGGSPGGAGGGFELDQNGPDENGNIKRLINLIDAPRQREAEEVHVKAYPSRHQFMSWRTNFRRGVVFASGRGIAVLQWILECERPGITFEELAEPGPQNVSLDAKIAIALTAILTGEPKRKVNLKAEELAKDGILIAGRQIVWLVYREFDLDEDQGVLYDERFDCTCISRRRKHGALGFELGRLDSGTTDHTT